MIKKVGLTNFKFSMKILVFGKYGQLAQSINEVIKGYSDIPEITFLSQVTLISLIRK